MFKKIDHVELIPADFDRALTFYTEILGFRVKSRAKVAAPPLEEIAYLALGETVLELMRVTDPIRAELDPWQVGCRMIALEVEDMDAAIAYLASKGVSISWGPVTLGPSKRAEFKDSEGFSVELRQW